jgi:hypothetical protein
MGLQRRANGHERPIRSSGVIFLEDPDAMKEEAEGRPEDIEKPFTEAEAVSEPITESGSLLSNDSIDIDNLIIQESVREPAKIPPPPLSLKEIRKNSHVCKNHQIMLRSIMIDYVPKKPPQHISG